MSKIRQSLVRTFSARFSPGHVIDWHSHSWAQLMYASEGAITVETESACWVVGANRGIWIPNNTLHSVKTHGRVFLQTVYFDPEGSEISRLPCTAYVVSPLVHELIVHVCELGMVRGDSHESRNLVQFFTYQLKRLSSSPLMVCMPRESRARQLAARIIANPGTAESLAQLSSDCGLSLRSMQRLFSREVGLPLARWRNQVKMIHAVQLLANERPVTRIAFDLGFESVSAFIFSFRQHFGIPPAKYRSKQGREFGRSVTQVALKKRPG